MTMAPAALPAIDELKRVGIIAQKQKDRYLIRLRTVGGDLSSGELAAVAEVARKYGSGGLHLTTRQAVEIHNIHVEDLTAAREELEQSGIVLGVCGPRGRGIVACPGAATCTSGIIETKQLAAELDAAYFRRQAPHKFKIGVAGCPNSCSKPIENDIGVMGAVLPAWDQAACSACGLCVGICPTQAITGQDNELALNDEACINCGLCITNCPSGAWTARRTGYRLFLGGTLGKKPRLATKVNKLIESKEELLGLIERAWEFYLAQGKRKERFGHTLDRIGLEASLAEMFGEPDRTRTTERREAARAAACGPVVDLRGVCCPMNFVRAKLAMEQARTGDRIEFLLDDGEPVTNVTRSLKDEGHPVLRAAPEEGYFRVTVEKR